MSYPSGSRLTGATTQFIDATGTEDVTVWTGRTTPTAGSVPLIYCHGSGGTGIFPFWRINTIAADDFRAICAWGFPLFVPDMAGENTWGNNACIAAVDSVVTWANGRYGTRTDKIALGGESMGALTALNWAWRYPTKVAAVWLRVPVVGLLSFYQRNTSFQNRIETAYTNWAGLMAALPTHDPAQNIDSIRVFRDRLSVWYARSDELIPAADTLAFVQDVDCQVDSVAGTHINAYLTPEFVVASWLNDTIRANS